MSRIVAGLRRHWPSVAIAAAAAIVVFAFLAVVLEHTKLSLPIEDGYIYLTYAKQFGRGQPFTYFPGGGYSAGSTSVIWPMVLAPFWTLGARGEGLVWVSFFLCGTLYAATGVLCGAVVRKIYGPVAAALASVLALGIAPFAFTALSGMEVAFASALLVAAVYQLFATGPTGPPRALLVVTLACLALSRPEAMIIVAGVVGVRTLQRLRRREWRAAVLWAAAMVPTVLWLAANRAFAGHWFPNTGVAKSHFYLPGFDWTYWWDAVTQQTKAMVVALFWDKASPLVWPRLFALLWIVGAVRVLVWAVRESKVLVGLIVVFAPFLLILAVIASSGAWTFHHYRYISSAFPLLMVTAACGIAPRRLPERFTWAPIAHRAWQAVCLLVMVVFVGAAWGPMRGDMNLYAQNATDLNRQVVTIGRYLHDNLPDAHVMFHDAGAIAYYGDTPVFDMLGLVTNDQARVANNGPGSRFEFLESLPPDRRPTHFAYYPAWMGQSEFYGNVVLRTPLAPAFYTQRLIGDQDMQLIEARWDRVHTAEQPLTARAGWSVVDRIDVADIASEDAHAWRGGLGRRRFADPTARWSVFHKDVTPAGELLDGGRTIRTGTERFTATVDPGRPVSIVMRTGGKRDYAYNEPITAPVEIVLSDEDDGTELGRATLPAPTGAFAEVALEITARHAPLHVAVRANHSYRVFHWFVLQPS